MFTVTDPVVIIELLTHLDNHNRNQGITDKFRLWHRIAELYPETRKGQWHIQTANTLTLEIREGYATADP